MTPEGPITQSGQNRPHWSALIAVFVGVLLADQITKAVVEGSLKLGERNTIAGDFAILYTHNDGVAFGAFGGAQTVVIVFTVLALIGLLIYFARRGYRRLLWLPTGLLLGGAIGNLIDRVRQDSVTDFIKVPYWPVFNIADIAITVGVVLLVITIEVGSGKRSS